MGLMNLMCLLCTFALFYCWEDALPAPLAVLWSWLLLPTGGPVVALCVLAFCWRRKPMASLEHDGPEWESPAERRRNDKHVYFSLSSNHGPSNKKKRQAQHRWARENRTLASMSSKDKALLLQQRGDGADNTRRFLTRSREEIKCLQQNLEAPCTVMALCKHLLVSLAAQVLPLHMTYDVYVFLSTAWHKLQEHDKLVSTLHDTEDQLATCQASLQDVNRMTRSQAGLQEQLDHELRHKEKLEKSHTLLESRTKDAEARAEAADKTYRQQAETISRLQTDLAQSRPVRSTGAAATQTDAQPRVEDILAEARELRNKLGAAEDYNLDVLASSLAASALQEAMIEELQSTVECRVAESTELRQELDAAEACHLDLLAESLAASALNKAIIEELQSTVEFEKCRAASADEQHKVSIQYSHQEANSKVAALEAKVEELLAANKALTAEGAAQQNTIEELLAAKKALVTEGAAQQKTIEELLEDKSKLLAQLRAIEQQQHNALQADPVCTTTRGTQTQQDDLSPAGNSGADIPGFTTEQETSFVRQLVQRVGLPLANVGKVLEPVLQATEELQVQPAVDDTALGAHSAAAVVELATLVDDLSAPDVPALQPCPLQRETSDVSSCSGASSDGCLSPEPSVVSTVESTAQEDTQEHTAAASTSDGVMLGSSLQDAGTSDTTSTAPALAAFMDEYPDLVKALTEVATHKAHNGSGMRQVHAAGYQVVARDVLEAAAEARKVKPLPALLEQQVQEVEALAAFLLDVASGSSSSSSSSSSTASSKATAPGCGSNTHSTSFNSTGSAPPARAAGSVSNIAAMFGGSVHSNRSSKAQGAAGSPNENGGVSNGSSSSSNRGSNGGSISISSTKGELVSAGKAPGGSSSRSSPSSSISSGSSNASESAAAAAGDYDGVDADALVPELQDWQGSHDLLCEQLQISHSAKQQAEQRAATAEKWAAKLEVELELLQDHTCKLEATLLAKEEELTEALRAAKLASTGLEQAQLVMDQQAALAHEARVEELTALLAVVNEA